MGLGLTPFLQLHYFNSLGGECNEENFKLYGFDSMPDSFGMGMFTYLGAGKDRPGISKRKV